ncbi:MAG: hypothetical protein U0168_04550 [Nannocystaceae bacterium]
MPPRCSCPGCDELYSRGAVRGCGATIDEALRVVDPAAAGGEQRCASDHHRQGCDRNRDARREAAVAVRKIQAAAEGSAEEARREQQRAGAAHLLAAGHDCSLAPEVGGAMHVEAGRCGLGPRTTIVATQASRWR